MTNPYQQQHGSSNFDSLASAGLPPPTARRPSYASVVSGNNPVLSRPSRSGFSHLLNPSPDSEQQQQQQQQPYAGNLYATSPDSGMAHIRNGASAEDVPAGIHQGNNAAMWHPRLGSSFPHFSRAFDLYMNKDPLFSPHPAGPEDVRFAPGNPMPNISSTGFLSPSYLRGTVYLQTLEEKHRAKILAEREGHTSNGQPGARSSVLSQLGISGNVRLPLPVNKVSGSAHRGVAYDIVETPLSAEASDAIDSLPSRWNKEDKEGALEVMGDGYEVRHTGRSLDSHEASAIRADHYMSPYCGVYYFEITVLNKKKDK